MKRILLLTLLLNACYTETKKPDRNFMAAVAKQASLDSTMMTSIEIIPSKYYFGKVLNPDSLRGSFVLKNTGKQIFKVAAVHTGCSCISVQYAQSAINPGDSLVIHFQLAVPQLEGITTNSIVVVGNCPAGNKTYYFEATIIH